MMNRMAASLPYRTVEHICARLSRPRRRDRRDNPATGQPVDFTDPVSAESYRQYWCGKIREAEEPETGGSRDDPRNAWTIHPLVDGCKPPIIIT
jgi:hypothetical protein